MLIKYCSQKIAKSFSSPSAPMWKKFPQEVKEKYYSAANFMENASSLKDVFSFIPFHFERLKGDRKGQWSIRLGGTGYRVILYPCDSNGSVIHDGDILSICCSITIVEIQEVTNHYE